jgi:hypothetical protein
MNEKENMKIAYERAEMVKAMECIARSVNDEEVFELWLMLGVADGDIDSNTPLYEIIEMGYCDDNTFRDLMNVFLKLMKNAKRSGGLYCGDIVSDSDE